MDSDPPRGAGASGPTACTGLGFVDIKGNLEQQCCSWNAVHALLARCRWGRGAAHAPHIFGVEGDIDFVGGHVEFAKVARSPIRWKLVSTNTQLIEEVGVSQDIS